MRHHSKRGRKVRLTAVLRPLSRGKKRYEAIFLVQPGIEVIAPASALKAIGIKPDGKKVFELAVGRRVELPYGSAVMEFMGEVTCGRVIFGPEDTEPVLGLMMLESCGFILNPKNSTFTRLPRLSLKRLLVPA